MKLKYTYLTGIVAAAMFTACSSDTDSVAPNGDTGMMAVNVTKETPETTRANTQVYDFPVIVKDAEGNVVKSYERADAVPSTVLMAVGNYVVESHTPGEIQKRMTTPYYFGSADMEIKKDLTTNVDVICKMLNSSIQMQYDADFLNLFTAWTITLDDGTETALAFTNNDGNTPEAVYWYFENTPEELTLQFKGTTKAGAVISATRTLQKDEVALKEYPDADKKFVGGDVLVINFSPVESTSGNVTEILINANVSFDESETTIPVDVTVASLTPGTDEPGTGDDPTPGGDDLITLTIPAPVTLSADKAADADPSTGDVTMAAENGLKSVIVKVQSSSDEMMEQLAAVADEYPGVDLVNGCEVVGNQNLVAFLGSLGKEITVPDEGDTNYTFPVGQFYLFLGILPGEHNFLMTVTDMQGNKKTGTVKVTITE